MSQNHCSLYDVDENSVVGPGYKGRLLEPIVNPRKQWPSEEAFLSYLHATVFELAIRAGYEKLYQFLDVRNKVDEDDMLKLIFLVSLRCLASWILLQYILYFLAYHCVSEYVWCGVGGGWTVESCTIVELTIPQTRLGMVLHMMHLLVESYPKLILVTILILVIDSLRIIRRQLCIRKPRILSSHRCHSVLVFFAVDDLQ